MELSRRRGGCGRRQRQRGVSARAVGGGGGVTDEQLVSAGWRALRADRGKSPGGETGRDWGAWWRGKHRN